MMRVLKLLTVFLSMQVAADSDSGLNQLLVDGHELHASLKTIELENYPVRHLPTDLLPGNPHCSSDHGFVNAISRDVIHDVFLAPQKLLAKHSRALSAIDHLALHEQIEMFLIPIFISSAVSWFCVNF